MVIRCLVEGNSIRATVRLTGAAKNTVVKLLVEAGAACSKFMDEEMRNLPCKRIQPMKFGRLYMRSRRT